VCARDGGDESDRKDVKPQIAFAIFVLNYDKVFDCVVDISLSYAFILRIQSSSTENRKSNIWLFYFLQEYLVNLLERLDDIYYLCS
jgi:hypothetical protein